jgi:outer membrane receptor protein involved in Fe transport
MTKIVAAVLLMLAVSPPTVYAQIERGELRLLVTDRTGLPLRGAPGTLVSEAPQMYRSFATDDDGRFTLQQLPYGVYRVMVAGAGFAPHTEIVEIRSAVPTELRIELSVAPLASQVDVTATPPLIDPQRTGVAHTVAGPQLRDQLTAVPGRGLLDLIDAQPGWLMEANGVLHPRGSEYQTLFVVDGIPMDENRSPAFAPDLGDAEVHAISVLTGNFPAEYGRKLGGVVEVTTSRDRTRGFRGSADVSAGSFGLAAGAFNGSYGWGGRSLSFGGSAARTDRYLDPPVRENYSNSGSLRGATIGYEDQPGESDRVQLGLHVRGNSYLVPNEIPQEEAGQRQEADGREVLGQAGWTRVLSPRFVMSARGSVEHLSAGLDSNAQSTPIVVFQDRSFTRGYANASVAGNLGRHQIKFGGDLLYAPLREELAYRITDPSFFDDDTAQTFDFSDTADDREQSLFAQDTVTVGRVTVSAGIRWDRYSVVVDDDAFSPRLGIAWAPVDDLVVRGAYDRVFQTPAFENLLLASSPLVDEVGDEVARLPVLPSRGDFLEGGVTAGLGRRARLDVTGYRRTFDNFADDDVFLNTGISFPVAFASADIRGLDVKLTIPPTSRWSGFVSYGLLKGTADLPVVGGLLLGDEALEELEATGTIAITQDQRHTFRAQARYAVTPKLWLAATTRFGSGLPVELDDALDEDDLEELAEQYGEDVLAEVDFAAGRVKSNFAIDAGVGFELWRGSGAQASRRVTLRAAIANLGDQLNVINFAGLFSGTAIGAPRSATVRLRVDF